MVEDNLNDAPEISTALEIQEDAPYDSSDPAHVKKVAREMARRQRIADEGFAEIIALPKGRAWLWGILSFTNIFSTTFNLDPYASAFNEGKRSVGLDITATLQRLAPEVFSLMMKENKECAYG